MLAAASKACDEVIGSEVLGSRTDPASPPVVAITCADGSRLYLDPSASSRPAEPQRELASRAILSQTQALAVCEGKLRDGLPVPGSFERNPVTSEFVSAPGGGALVSFDFGARNGLGFPIAMHAECVLDGDRIARLEVQPR